MQLINEKPLRLWIIRPLDGSSHSLSLSLSLLPLASQKRPTSNERLKSKLWLDKCPVEIRRKGKSFRLTSSYSLLSKTIFFYRKVNLKVLLTARYNVAFNYLAISRTRNVRRCISGGNRITNSVPLPRPINLKPVPFVNRKISHELLIGCD